jgi:hypothetical protein
MTSTPDPGRAVAHRIAALVTWADIGAEDGKPPKVAKRDAKRLAKKMVAAARLKANASRGVVLRRVAHCRAVTNRVFLACDHGPPAQSERHGTVIWQMHALNMAPLPVAAEAEAVIIRHRVTGVEVAVLEDGAVSHIEHDSQSRGLRLPLTAGVPPTTASAPNAPTAPMFTLSGS